MALSETIVDDAARGGRVIYESLLMQGKQATKGQPAILAGMTEKGAREEAERILKAIKPLRDHLRYAVVYADLIEFKSETLIPNAETILEDWYSLLVDTPEGLAAYRTGLGIVRQLNDLLAGIDPVLRSTFADAFAYDWRKEAFQLEAFDWDGAIKKIDCESIQ